MRNLGAMGALLVIFIGSFYIGKASSDQTQTGTKVTNNESLKKEEKSNSFKLEASKGKAKGQKEKNRGPQSVVQEELGEEKVLKISDFINKGPYKKMAKLMKLRPEQNERNSLLRMIIALEEADSISHEDFLRSKDELLQFIKNNPEKSFKQMMGVVRSDVGRDNSSLRGQLMVAMSFVPGKEEEVKDLAIEELKTNIVPMNPRLSVPGKTDQVVKMMGAMEQVAVVKAYEAFLSASYKSLEDVQEETLDILSFQKNLTVRRNVAILYDRAFPSKRMEMLQKMKERGIHLMRPNPPRGLEAGADDYYENEWPDSDVYQNIYEEEREDV